MSLFIDDDIYSALRSVPNAEVFINGEGVGYYSTYQLPYTVEYRAVDGYVINFVEGGGVYDPVNDTITPRFEIVDGGVKAVAEFTDSDFNYNSYDFQIVEGSGVGADVIITQDFINKVSDINGILYIDDVVVNVNDEFNYPFTMKIIANVENVIFVSSTGVYDVINDSYKSFNISDDKKTMTYRFTSDDPFNASDWQFTSDVITPDVRGYNDVYLLTDEQVREIVDNSYGRFVGGGLNSSSEYLDYREYILGLLDIPFNIPDKLKTSNSNVKLGDLETGVNAVVLNDDQLIVDMGSITYVANENNSYDFMGVSCKLHLPFSDPLAIEPHYVINETLNIEYVVNLVDGKTFINIYSSKINGVILSHQIDLHCEIPFRIQETNPTNNRADSISYGNKNGVLTPYIEIMKNKDILPYGFFTVPIVDETVINNVNGYVEIENINLKGNINNDDQQNLINILRQGIINNV